MHSLSTTRIQLSTNLRSRRPALSSVFRLRSPLILAVILRRGWLITRKGKRPFRLSHREDLVPGGADRDRTDDPLLAKQVLSQLSYSPRSTGKRLEVRRRKVEVRHDILPSALILLTWLVGLGRFELPTSRLSGVRSNQLSYRPSQTRVDR